jgi:hypothetical protein
MTLRTRVSSARGFEIDSPDAASAAAVRKDRRRMATSDLQTNETRGFRLSFFPGLTSLHRRSNVFDLAAGVSPWGARASDWAAI